MTLLVQASQDTEEVPFLQKADSSIEPMDVGCSWLWLLKIVKTGPLFLFKGLGIIPCGSSLRAILMLTVSRHSLAGCNIEARANLSKLFQPLCLSKCSNLEAHFFLIMAFWFFVHFLFAQVAFVGPQVEHGDPSCKWRLNIRFCAVLLWRWSGLCFWSIGIANIWSILTISYMIYRSCTDSKHLLGSTLWWFFQTFDCLQ